MDFLPDHVVFRILEYLDYKSLCRIGQLQSRYLELSRHEVLWKRLCRHIWLLNAYLGCSNSWSSSFRGMYECFGDCLVQYKPVRLAWDRILAILDQKAPSIRGSLLPGLRDEHFKLIEDSLQCKLPLDLRCSYKIYSGQRPCSRAQGLFGNYEMDSPGDYLKSLVITYHHTSVADKTAFNSIAIVGCPNGSRTEIQICLSDSVYQHIRKGTVFAVAGGTGNDQTLRLQLYHYGDSFLEFLENWAEKLAGYPIVNQTILKYDDNSLEQTGPISVKVTTAFWREESFFHHDIPSDHQPKNARFAYRYRITLKMDPKAHQSDTCQLETRHWEITDEQGNVETVDGPGVVGTYPILQPGSEYCYISGTSYKTQYGNMKGYYSMRNLESGDMFNINIGVFHMRPPPILTFSQRKADWELAMGKEETTPLRENF